MIIIKMLNGRTDVRVDVIDAINCLATCVLHMRLPIGEGALGYKIF